MIMRIIRPLMTDQERRDENLCRQSLNSHFSRRCIIDALCAHHASISALCLDPNTENSDGLLFTHLDPSEHPQFTPFQHSIVLDDFIEVLESNTTISIFQVSSKAPDSLVYVGEYEVSRPYAMAAEDWISSSDGEKRRYCAALLKSPIAVSKLSASLSRRGHMQSTEPTEAAIERLLCDLDNGRHAVGYRQFRFVGYDWRLWAHLVLLSATSTTVSNKGTMLCVSKEHVKEVCVVSKNAVVQFVRKVDCHLDIYKTKIARIRGGAMKRSCLPRILSRLSSVSTQASYHSAWSSLDRFSSQSSQP